MILQLVHKLVLMHIVTPMGPLTERCFSLILEKKTKMIGVNST